MPPQTVRRNAKQAPAHDALSAVIDAFSLVLCVLMLVLTVSVLFVWRPIGLWIVFFVLAGLTGYLGRDVFNARRQLADMFAGFAGVLENLRPETPSRPLGGAAGKGAGRRPASAPAVKKAPKASAVRKAPAARKAARPAKRAASRRRPASR